ncbi:hypothetical protein OG218_00200 [Kineococcus sp. NBC_00420]|uniref:hypothetical protein n=1 Tax=Kineococcus sp. NBC_00420 TaxID=2903564 RepID=UPI002E1F8504
MRKRSARLWRVVALMSVLLIPAITGCSGKTTSQPEPMTSTGCSKPAVGQVSTRVTAQPDDGSPTPALTGSMTYSEGSPDGAAGGPLTEVTPCVVAVLSLLRDIGGDLDRGLGLESRMDHQSVDSGGGQGQVLITDQAVNDVDSQGGGSFGSFTGWYIDFSKAGPGSYQWTAPAHWSGAGGTSVKGVVQVDLDIAAEASPTATLASF